MYFFLYTKWLKETLDVRMNKSYLLLFLFGLMPNVLNTCGEDAISRP